MKEPTIKKHLKEAKYEPAGEQPDDKKRWSVTISTGTTLEVVAKDEKSAREAADEAYRNYLKVTGALEE